MEIVKAKTIAFTGNRNLTSPSGKRGIALSNAICNHLFALLEHEHKNNRITTFLSGMALGFDTLAALAVLELKNKYPDVQLVAVVPFVGQEEKYPAEDKKLYKKLLDSADHIVVISQDGYSDKAYHDRNDFLIANASKVVAYHNGKPRSGTGSTIRKSLAQGLDVVNLYELI